MGLGAADEPEGVAMTLYDEQLTVIRPTLVIAATRGDVSDGAPVVGWCFPLGGLAPRYLAASALDRHIASSPVYDIRECSKSGVPGKSLLAKTEPPGPLMRLSAFAMPLWERPTDFIPWPPLGDAQGIAVFTTWPARPEVELLLLATGGVRHA